MEIYPLGLSSFRIKGKTGTVVTDPFDPMMVGLKFPKIDGADILTVSHDHADHNHTDGVGGEPFVIKGPGEYEVKGITIVGIASYHDGSSGAERGKNTIYRMSVDNVNICHLGDLGHKLTDEQVDLIGDIDILFVPVGGFYTIDPKTAAAVVAQVEPYIVVPMHYKRAGMSEAFNKLDGVEKFLSEMGAEQVAPTNKLTVSKEKLPENTTVVVLES